MFNINFRQRMYEKYNQVFKLNERYSCIRTPKLNTRNILSVAYIFVKQLTKIYDDYLYS